MGWSGPVVTRTISIYSKLFYWNEVPKGGHFAALEQPDLFVAELRKSFAQVR
jgi:epoxide hydrolase